MTSGVTSGLTLHKLHGLCNDFLVMHTDLLPSQAEASRAAVALCDRHRGLGADGLIYAQVASPVEGGTPSAVMRLWNADGSSAEVSGNGLRCLAHSIARTRGVDSLDIVISTLAGPRRCSIRVRSLTNSSPGDSPPGARSNAVSAGFRSPTHFSPQDRLPGAGSDAVSAGFRSPTSSPQDRLLDVGSDAVSAGFRSPTGSSSQDRLPGAGSDAVSAGFRSPTGSSHRMGDHGGFSTAVGTVEMGNPEPGPLPDDLGVDPLAVAQELIGGHGVSRWQTVQVGNPHVVFAVTDPAAVDLQRAGAALEALFCGGINVHFCSVTGPDELTLRVWERGVGVTEACGSGAVAAAAVFRQWGVVGRNVVVRMAGGDARVDLAVPVTLTGESVYIATITLGKGQ